MKPDDLNFDKLNALSPEQLAELYGVMSRMIRQSSEGSLHLAVGGSQLAVGSGQKSSNSPAPPDFAGYASGQALNIKGDPPLQSKCRTGFDTRREWVAEYERYVKEHLSNAYWVSVRNANDYLERYFPAEKSLADIDMRVAESFLAFLQERVKRGYRVYFRNIKAMFNKFVDWGYIDRNPFAKVKLPRKQDLKPMFMNKQELDAVLAFIKNEVIRDICTFGFFTGCRLDEIVSLRWCNVNLSGEMVTIGDAVFTTKTRKQRMIPMCEEVTSLLSRRLDAMRCVSSDGNIMSIDEKNAYVFTNKSGEKVSKDYTSKRFKLACIKAGVDSGIHFHSLRHSFASNLVQNNVALYTVKELLGHGSITTTQIYAHLNMDSLRDAVKIFNRN